MRSATQHEAAGARFAREQTRRQGVRSALVVSHRIEVHGRDHLGAITSTLGIWRAVSDLGIRVTRLCPATGAANARALGELSSGSLSVRTTRMTPSSPPSLASFPDIRREVADADPDVVHVIGEPWQRGVVGTINAGRSRGAICGVHFAENGPALQGVQGWLRSVRARSALRRADYVVGWSRTAAQVASKAWGFHSRIDHFPSTGVPEWFFAQESLRDPTEPTVVFAARLAEEKGVLDAIELARRLSPRGIRFVIAGAGPLERAVRAAADAGVVRYVGYIRSESLAHLLSSAHITVVPSRTSAVRGPAGLRIPLVEQFGRIVVESLATGTPVVAYRTGEIPDTLGPGGFLVPEGDLDALEETIRFALADTIMWRRAADSGREWALRFSDRHIAQRLVDLWNTA